MSLGFWEYLDRGAERRVKWRKVKLAARRPGFWERSLPTDFRGWLGFALFAQSTFLFALLALFPALRESQGFLTLASAVIVTGWIGGAAAFAYAAGKGNSEQRDLTDRALRVAENAQNGGGPTKPDVTLKPGETAQAEESPS